MDFDLTIYLTNRCNLFCDHCDRSSGNAAPNELSTAEILASVDSLNKEIKHICLSGGEPVQYKDFFYVAETLMKKGFQVSFITNATFSPAYYQKILELPFTGIYVSLDGTEKIHNLLRRSGLSFKRVIQFLEFISDYLNKKPVVEIGLDGTLAEPKSLMPRVFSGDLYIVTCVTSKSVNDLDALSELLSKYKITQWFLKPIEMKGRALEHPELELDAAMEQQLSLIINRMSNK